MRVPLLLKRGAEECTERWMLVFSSLSWFFSGRFSMLQGSDWAHAIQMMEYVAPVQKVPLPTIAQSHRRAKSRPPN